MHLAILLVALQAIYIHVLRKKHYLHSLGRRGKYATKQQFHCGVQDPM